MTYDRIKKAIVAVALTAAFILSAGVANTSVAAAQYRERRWGWQERNRERHEMYRIRSFDRDRQLRYRMNGTTRLVGYYDRFGRFHAQGFYDRFGRFHRY
jgi:hypothetical protein